MSRDLVAALAGNPNSGKSTVFNSLTGVRQHVGNWPGVTVERKEGVRQYDGRTLRFVDLPGVYSLTAYAPDELVARNFVVEESPDVVVDIVDAASLERNLYLTVQLLEMGANLVLVLNMMDTAQARGYRIDVDKLSQLLGVPVVAMTATSGEGMEELLQAVTDVADGRRPARGLKLEYDRELEKELGTLEQLIRRAKPENVSEPRWLAVKVLEEDEEVARNLEEWGPKGLEVLGAGKESIDRIERIYGDDAETMAADARYGFIGGLVREVLSRPSTEKLTLTDLIDSLVINRLLGLPVFLALLYAVFQFTFVLSAPLMDWIEEGYGWLAGQVGGVEPGWLGSLLADGIIGGVGSVLVFVPPIFLLFVAIAILEDSGYMARAAFVMDKVMHNLKLHGRSFVPMMIGFGCTVPAVMATRTIENPKDRLVTILVTPFVSCGARLPIYILFAAAFFTAHQGLVVFSMYIIGLGMAFMAAWFLRRFVVTGPSGHFVMELPPYRLPTIRGIVIHTWERGRAFLVRAGTIIFAVVVIVWLLDYTGALEPIGRAIAPLLSPAGLGQWETAVALVFGVLAKEIVIGAFGTLFTGAEELGGLGNLIGFELGWTALVAYCFMLFTLIYVPCVATLGVIRGETKSWRWPIFAAVFTTALAWVVAVLVYQVGSLFIV